MKKLIFVLPFCFMMASCNSQTVKTVKMDSTSKPNSAYDRSSDKKVVSKGKYGDQEVLEKSRELKWIKETEICVVLSSEQNEIQKFQKWDLDIEPHREKMNTQDLETRFKDEDDPFRFVIVCAM